MRGPAAGATTVLRAFVVLRRSLVRAAHGVRCLFLRARRVVLEATPRVRLGHVAPLVIREFRQALRVARALLRDLLERRLGRLAEGDQLLVPFSGVDQTPCTAPCTRSGTRP